VGLQVQWVRGGINTSASCPSVWRLRSSGVVRRVQRLGECELAAVVGGVVVAELLASGWTGPTVGQLGQATPSPATTGSAESAGIDVEVRDDLVEVFEAAGADGTFVLYDVTGELSLRWAVGAT
jgi:hypothetical protein